jgi:hypothetical protein
MFEIVVEHVNWLVILIPSLKSIEHPAEHYRDERSVSTREDLEVK